MNVDEERIFVHNDFEEEEGAVLYWMRRDFRLNDNWALHLACEIGTPVYVLVAFGKADKGISLRQWDFWKKGLIELESALKKQGISLIFSTEEASRAIPKMVKSHSIKTVIADFHPFKEHRKELASLKKTLRIPLYEVDAHNIVPTWVASEKLEFAARTFRPKITKLLPSFLTPFPNLKKGSKTPFKGKNPSWEAIEKKLQIDRSVPPVSWITPGETAAKKALSSFISKKLSQYESLRNDPSEEGQSNLSPYLHFGQIAAQRVALEVKKSKKNAEGFLEELIVRRELSDNYCYYNPHYDSPKGFPEWAKKSLAKHKKDARKVYSKKKLEEGKTDDPLWNAAQLQLIHHGKLHGYMRMYWAKKILEWSSSPETAFRLALELNDRYERDGRDPNGYVGVAWSIGGVHDRPWQERKIFGQIRYMNAAGCERKFDTDAYIKEQS